MRKTKVKDAFYFPHDSNSKDDPKCVMLIEQLGLEGYGIFWILIETLRDQPEYKYPIVLISALSRRYNTTTEKMKAVINGYGLFTVDENDFFSLSLLRRMELIEDKRDKARKAINSRWDKQKQLPGSNKINTDVIRTNNERNTDELQVKESKVKESKVNNNILSSIVFDDDSIPFKLALKLQELIIKNNPEAKQSDLQKWATEFDRMIRLDNRNSEQIIDVMEFSQTDSFWKTNILSPKKLREKYDTLNLQKQNKKAPQQKDKPPNMNNMDQRQYSKDYIDRIVKAYDE